MCGKEIMQKIGEDQSHIDNDIVEPKRRYYDYDIVWREREERERTVKDDVLDEITEYRLDRVHEFLFGHNHFMSDCGVFINPAIKQLERFMDFWVNELSDDARKKIVNYRTEFDCSWRDYKDFTESPLWKYESSVFKLATRFRCERCGGKFNPAYLVAHHLTYDHVGSEILYPDDIMVVCNKCHREIHNIKEKKEND